MFAKLIQAAGEVGQLVVRKEFFLPGQDQKSPDYFQAFAHEQELARRAEPALHLRFTRKISGGDTSEAGGDFTQYLLPCGQTEILGQVLVRLPIQLVKTNGVAVELRMLEHGTHAYTPNILIAELLEAAQTCGASLQKSLALPGIASLCAELAEALLSRSWKPGRHTRFAVQEPKLREIFAPSFADRVVQTWLSMRMEPILERCLIDDTYATRKGKGPLAAIRKVQKYMRQPGHVWCLQLDVRGFFHAIHRPTLLRLWLDHLERQTLPSFSPFSKDTRDLMRFISTALLAHDAADNYTTVSCSRSLLAKVPPHKSLLHAPPDTGMPIGSATSQSFANFYLSGLDHFVKHSLRVKGYIRYMDDLLLLGPDAATLTAWRDAIAAYLHDELRLSLHPGKTHLVPARQGIAYLGYRVYPHHAHIGSRNIKALKARLDFFKHLFWPEAFPFCQKPVRGTWQGLMEAGEIVPPQAPDWLTLKRMESTINSYFGLMGHAESYGLRKMLYHKHFGPLRSFFVPADAGYIAVHVKKLFLHQ